MYERAIGQIYQGSEKDREERKRFEGKISQVAKLYPETLSNRFDPLAFKHRFESTYSLKIIFKVIERIPGELSKIEGDIWIYAMKALRDEAKKALGNGQDATERTGKTITERPTKKVIEMPISEPFAEDDDLEKDTQKSGDDNIQCESIPGGAFNIARKIFSSQIWVKHPFYLKVWLWIIGQANHSDHEKNGKRYKRGELVTTYDDIIKGVAYHYRHRLIFPSIQQIRDILKWLQSKEMIIVQPLRKSNLSAGEIIGDTTGLGTDPKAGDKTDPKRREKTYLGIKIIVVNYNTYQSLWSYKKTDPKAGDKTDPKAGDKTEGFSEIQHDNKNVKNDKDIYAQNFLSFYETYPRHVAKKSAHKAWQKLEKAEDMETLLPTLLDAIAKQKQARETAKAKGEFFPECPYPATWLNGERWKDEVEIKKRWDHAG